MANNSKKSLEQIASNNYLIDLQKLTRVVHLYDLSFVETHINCFDLTKTDELEFVFNLMHYLCRWDLPCCGGPDSETSSCSLRAERMLCEHDGESGGGVEATDDAVDTA